MSNCGIATLINCDIVTIIASITSVLGCGISMYNLIRTTSIKRQVRRERDRYKFRRERESIIKDIDKINQEIMGYTNQSYRGYYHKLQGFLEELIRYNIWEKDEKAIINELIISTEKCKRNANEERHPVSKGLNEVIAIIKSAAP